MDTIMIFDREVAANKEATDPRVPSWSYHFQGFTVATMTWGTIREYLCHR